MSNRWNIFTRWWTYFNPNEHFVTFQIQSSEFLYNLKKQNSFTSWSGLFCNIQKNKGTFYWTNDVKDTSNKMLFLIFMWADDKYLIILLFENIKYIIGILFVVIMNMPKKRLKHFVLLSWRRIQIDHKSFVWHCFFEWNVKLIMTFLQWSCIAINIAEYMQRKHFQLINRLFGCKFQLHNLSIYFSLPKYEQYPIHLLNDTVLIMRISTWT